MSYYNLQVAFSQNNDDELREILNDLDETRHLVWNELQRRQEVTQKSQSASGRMNRRPTVGRNEKLTKASVQFADGVQQEFY